MDVTAAHTNGGGGESFGLIDDGAPIENFSQDEEVASDMPPRDSAQDASPAPPAYAPPRAF
jgi:hypothetical protein